MKKSKKSILVALILFFSPFVVIFTYMIIAKELSLDSYDVSRNIVTLPDFVIGFTGLIWIIAFYIFWFKGRPQKNNKKKVIKQSASAINNEIVNDFSINTEKLNETQIEQEIYKPLIRNKVEQLAHDILISVNYDKIETYKQLREITGYDFEKISEIVDIEYERSKPVMYRKMTCEFHQREKENSYVTQTIREKPLTKKTRIAENKRNAVACCPKCGSTSLSAHKKGFGIGKAIVGVAATAATFGTAPLLGAVAGNLGAKKVRVTCMNCGKQFWAGKH